ncbi:MAG: enoyl-CoA hydratase-related protein [Saprospiraceae bacterium]
MGLKIEIKNSIAYLIINRPEKYNSINKETAMAIQKELDNCSENDNVRAIVLTGTGKAFCAGQDLGEVVDPNGPALEDIVSKHYNPIIARIRAIQKPIIAAVNGVAAGAGANIALSCDIVIAAESASFIQAFSKIGLIPDSGGTFYLPRLVGFAKASALMMLGDKVSASEAEKMGMIYKCVPNENFEKTYNNIAQKLASMPTQALGYTKKLLNSSWNNTLEQQLAMEHEYQYKSGQSEDYKEGVEAFLEKRKPTFKGK